MLKKFFRNILIFLQLFAIIEKITFYAIGGSIVKTCFRQSQTI